VTPEEAGTLVLRLQDDDVLPFELRRFLRLLMTDPEVRRNARLAGQLSGLPQETRRAHCIANALFLVTDPQLSPPEDAVPDPASQMLRKHRMLAADKRTFLPAMHGNWRQHLIMDGASPAFPSAAEIAKMRNKKGWKLPNVWVSSVLAEYFSALEDFWDVRDILLQ
jgi:hypothetical protein